jgi:hypothetical protein
MQSTPCLAVNIMRPHKPTFSVLEVPLSLKGDLVLQKLGRV